MLARPRAASIGFRSSAGSGSRSSSSECAPLRHGEIERALEVDARDVALLGQLGEQPGALGEAVHVAGHGRGDGGGAVQPVGVDALEDLLDGPGGEGGAAAAVVVEVHEAGDEQVARQVQCPRRRGRAAGDACAVDDHTTVDDDSGGQYHPAPARTVLGHQVVTSEVGREAVVGWFSRSQASRPAPGSRRCPRGPRARGTAVSGR